MSQPLLKSPDFMYVNTLNSMSERSGLSLEKMKAAHDKRVAVTADAMEERGIARPDLTLKPGLKITESKFTSGSCVLTHYPYKGIKAKPIILYVHDSITLEDDFKLWWHLSISRADRKMPTYQNLALVREKVMGDRWCIQYFPPQSQYVNDHPTCLHLWHCLEEDEVLPDFRKLGSI